MNLYSAFWKAARSRPLEAIGALYWHLTGRKVRARNRLRISLAQSPCAYPLWVRNIEHSDLAFEAVPAAIAKWHHQPTFSVIVHRTADQGAATVDALVTMMRSQIYPAWELVVISAPGAPDFDIADTARIRISDEHAATEAEVLRIGTRIATGDFLIALPAASTLPPTSLYRYAETLQGHPTAKLLYGDNDWINAQGQRYLPWFKPEWNSELALAQDYLSQAMAVSREEGAQALQALHGQPASSYAWALAMGAAHPQDVRHVPHIQNHLRDTGEAEPSQDRLLVVQAFLDRMDTGATASAGRHGTIRVDWPLVEPCPLVSIIIPTRDKVSLLRACVESLLERTSYQPFEILIVDNGSREDGALAYLEHISKNPIVRVIRDDRPYNFSQLNNLAAAQSAGAYLCLLNNDTEIVDGNWLTAMMRQAVRPAAGAVGARLLYADGTIQHAGVVVGLGTAAGHAHRFLASDEVGYFSRSHAAHWVSAVTAACLVVAKDKFLNVGGLDERDLAIAFNDVDLCLRLQAAGWHNVYTPSATLLHHESKSRGKDVSPRHIERYRRELRVLQERWGTRNYADPLHHPNLDPLSETYLIKMWSASDKSLLPASEKPRIGEAGEA